MNFIFLFASGIPTVFTSVQSAEDSAANRRFFDFFDGCAGETEKERVIEHSVSCNSIFILILIAIQMAHIPKLIYAINNIIILISRRGKRESIEMRD